MSDSVTGKIAYSLWQSDSGTESVVVVKTDNGNVTIKGSNLPDNKRLKYTFTGEWQPYRNTKTLYVTDYETVKPNTRKSSIRYLCSGLYQGIGEKIATKIVDHFGDDAVTIFETQPDKLSEVQGIGPSTITKIKKKIAETTYMKELVKEMSPYLSAEQCAKLVRYFGSDVLPIIKRNPYKAFIPLHLSFAEVDYIALEMGCSPMCLERIQAAFHFCMMKFNQDGNTGVPVKTFKTAVDKLLNHQVTAEAIDAFYDKAIQDDLYKSVKLIVDSDSIEYVFNSRLYNIEKKFADHIEYIRQFPVVTVPDVEDKIRKIVDTRHITLDDTQFTAVKTGVSAPLTIVTGGPGTGKTTIMDIIAEYERLQGRTVTLIATTGRAARHLSESTNRPAHTMHSAIGIYDTEDVKEETLTTEFKNQTIIIDEFSMADVVISELFFSRIKEGCKVIIVGDVDQLPSVGPGAVLRDLISHGNLPVIRLQHVFRTDKDGLILTNTRKVNVGDTRLYQGDDFRAYKCSDLHECKELITDLFKKRVAEYGIEQTILLLPTRKNECGVEDMNRHLQEIINPPADSKMEFKHGGTIYREGDPVMHVHCNTPLASNGDIGMVTGIREIDNIMSVQVMINGELVTYTKEDLCNLDLAYAMTIHKSQGSEAKAVITCINSHHGPMLYRNIPYVAFSRAKAVVDCIYDEGLWQAIKTVKSDKRITLLPYFLACNNGDFVAGDLSAIFEKPTEQ